MCRGMIYIYALPIEGASHTHKKGCKVGKNGGQWGHLEESLKSSSNPASSFLQGHDSAQQKVPTAIACAQLTEAAALIHYHKNAVCGVCVGVGAPLHSWPSRSKVELLSPRLHAGGFHRTTENLMK